ncbi:MAG: MaoC/PaaZ C-terminal domain-containing protein [Kistimonas sp.]|nr:MaoC/PaaZ C-terminal domain-containing protein [Kistimonas sp.]
MTDTQTLVLSGVPSLLALYGRAAVKKEHSGTLPQLGVCVPGVRPELSAVRRYEQICHFAASRYLPPSWPQVMAFPLHMQLLVDPAMPLRPMGLIHIRNSFRQYRPVEKGALLHIECTLGSAREQKAGLEFDIETRIQADGELVWEGTSTNLSRRATPESGGKKPQQPVQHWQVLQSWKLPADLGRRYARVSGDRNPIHMWPLTARLFGFRRPIAHGLWSKARCLAALMEQTGPVPLAVDVRFKTPAFLPGQVEFSHTPLEEAEVRFLLCSASGRPHLTGVLELL